MHVNELRWQKGEGMVKFGHVAGKAGGAGTGGEGSGTVGAVDLGGSSLEVSFVPDESASAGSDESPGGASLTLHLHTSEGVH